MLLMLVMGIMEFGIMFKNYLNLAQVANVGCRSAALGSNTTVIGNYINTTATGLGLAPARITSQAVEYRVFDKTTQVWTGWQTLGDGTGGYNNAPCDVTHDSQIRVRLGYTYPLVTGAFLSSFVGQNGNVVLSGTAAMRREETP